MDGQKIFDQLDRLQRGARYETQPQHDQYNDSSAEYSAYDGHEHAFGDAHGAQYGYDQYGDDFVEQPMVMDSFDEQLLRQPDPNSRHSQAALGRARLSLGPNSTQQPQPGMRREPLAPRSLNLSRFAFEPEHGGPSSSSLFEQPLPSSPAYNASQRRPSAYESGHGGNESARHRAPMDFGGQSSAFQPFDAQQQDEEDYSMHGALPEPVGPFQPSYSATQPAPKPRQPANGPPVVQGINLVSAHELPDRFRSIFPFPLFNAVQSKCFQAIYRTNDNFVLSAPTGSGKTAVLELAICRLINGFSNGSFKIVYQAPTKSLCAERQRDWQAKFGPLGLQCAELTGDTDNAQLRNVQHASIIVTTPEKWDSMTRKWKDHQKLMQMVKLFLIDEVHILKEDRGATLEAVVSRMKSVGSDVRFIALSATVPNSEDIATWLGKDPINQQVPAARERFGEEFRPVRLQKHVCGYQGNANDFAFEKMLNSKLTDVIVKWSQRKPIMVFCFTRGSCVETAKLLATWWATNGPKDRYWTSPRQQIVVGDKDLKDTISSGVAFHHAGLKNEDRNAVERGYLSGDINVICCTSTLAVGVNLPCHMVIIKNTVTYQSSQAGGVKEYSDLETMQMLGRAGRPQFDDSAVAVIMTRMQRVQYYEKMITGQELLESCLHRNLIDHLNAEIGLGTISNASSAKRWLAGTFLYVRLKENPEHYKLDDDAPGRNLDERLENICRKGIALLEDNDLVKSAPKLTCTEFGDAMARYYLQFDTMKHFLALPPKAKVSEILSAVAQAAEFKDIRFRAGEKNAYKDLNKNCSIKFPIPVNIDLPAHKVSLVIQAILGAIDLPTEDHKHRTEFGAAKITIFQHVHRLVRCIIDCQLYLDDAVSVRNALMLARSLGAQVWDDSPLHMKQLETVGPATVRKLAVAGIKSVEDIENADAHRLENILSRNPPYGAQLQQYARAFPKLRVSLKMMGEPIIKKGEYVTVKVRADIGFLNERVPETFQKRAVYVCLLAETSDGNKIHFARISAKKLDKGQDLLFSANLVNAGQTIRAYVMCDEIAGTAKHASLKPAIPAFAFPPPKTAEEMNKQRGLTTNVPNTSKRRASANKSRVEDDDEFGDAGIDDADLALFENGGFVDIDDLGSTAPKQKKQKTSHQTATDSGWEPLQLPNGKWACNHTCKDKTTCKHMCCRDGVDKKPKQPPKTKESKKQAAEPGSDPKQTQLSMTTSKKAAVPTSTTPAGQSEAQRKTEESREARDLNRLHNSVQSTTPKVPMISKDRAVKPSMPDRGGQAALSFLNSARFTDTEASSDYGAHAWDEDDFPDIDSLPVTQRVSGMSPPKDPPVVDEAEDDMLDDAHEGIADSAPGQEGSDGQVDFSAYANNLGQPQDAEWQYDEPYDSLIKQGPAMPREVTTSDDLFNAIDNTALVVGDNPDSAGTAATSQYCAPIPQEIVTAKVGRSKFFMPTQQKAPSRTPSKQLQDEFDQTAQPAAHDDFLAGAADVEMQQEQPSSPDSLEKWFNNTFGAEQFNYIR